MPQEEHILKKVLRLITAFSLIGYVIFFFQILFNLVYMAVVFMALVYFVMFMFGAGGFFSDITSAIGGFILSRFRFSLMMYAVLFIFSIFILVASARMLQRRKREFVLTVTCSNLVFIIMFGIFYWLESFRLMSDFKVMVLSMIVVGFLTSLSGAVSTILSWNSYKLKYEVEAEMEEKRKRIEARKKKREDSSFYEDSERSYREKYPVRTFEEEYYPDLNY